MSSSKSPACWRQEGPGATWPSSARAGGGSCGASGGREGEGGLIHKSGAAVTAAASRAVGGLCPRPPARPPWPCPPLPCLSPTPGLRGSRAQGPRPWGPGDIATQHGGAGAPSVREARGDVGQMAAVLRHDCEDVVDGESGGRGPLCALRAGTPRQSGEGGPGHQASSWDFVGSPSTQGRMSP